MEIEATVDWGLAQKRLKELGYDPGPIDGVRGPKTDAAIVAFKRSIGLRARPYFGPLTQKALRGIHPRIYGPNRTIKDGRDVPELAEMPWMSVARDVMGLHEARDYSALKRWFDKSVAWIDPRELPWCGAFPATCYRMWEPDTELPDNPLGARNWLKFGDACEPQLGACMVFWRGSRSGWQGHVAYYWGEDDTHFHVLGGNQNNAVTVTRIAKGRLLGARWPLDTYAPRKRVRLSPAGVPITTNEA